MSQYAEQLESIVESPRSRAVEVDWDSVESSLVVSLSGDYKEFVEVYGPGESDNFIAVMDRRPVDGVSGILEIWREEIYSFSSLKDVVPFPSWVSNPEDVLSPRAETSNDDTYFCQMTPSNDSDLWNVVLCDDELDGRYYFPGKMTHFLVSAQSGDIDSDFFVNLSPLGESCFVPGGAG
ncbi:hypothetical protein [Actinopolyspora mortivallis]|uniref:hypothetical protein n=1 Tax=Actinopolyspora mortivallis TaxID=33906 RepID=UPI0011B1DF8D|nr:hypothetical protein [Actinopolyspora mortivallis]